MQRKSQGAKKPFNCEEKRQPEFTNIETPGPGNYFQNIEAAKADAIKRSSSMFISKTKRNSAYNKIVKKTKDNPGLERVCYDDATNTIGDIIRKKKE